VSLSFVGWLARVDKSAKGVKFRHLPLAHHVVWEDEIRRVYDREQRANPQTLQGDYKPEQYRALTSRKYYANAHLYLHRSRLLNNFNAINANANITGNNINETGIRVLARD